MADPFWRSTVVRGAIIAACGLFCTGAASAAVNFNDRLGRLETAEAVRCERDKHMAEALDRIEHHLGTK